jgi:hypothetical protein
METAPPQIMAKHLSVREYSQVHRLMSHSLNAHVSKIISVACYHAATGTAQPSATHHDDHFSNSSVFPADSSSWVGSDWGECELLIKDEFPLEK